MAVRREGAGLVKTKNSVGEDTGRCRSRCQESKEKWGLRYCLLKGALTHNTWTLRKIVKPVSSRK